MKFIRCRAANPAPWVIAALASHVIAAWRFFSAGPAARAVFDAVTRHSPHSQPHFIDFSAFGPGMVFLLALRANFCIAFDARLGFFANSWLAVYIGAVDQIWVSIDFKWQKESLIACVVICWNETLDHFLVADLLALIVQTFQIIYLTFLNCGQNIATNAIRTIGVHTPNNYYHLVWPFAFVANNAGFVFVVYNLLITTHLAWGLFTKLKVLNSFYLCCFCCRKSVATLPVLIKSQSI